MAAARSTNICIRCTHLNVVIECNNILLLHLHINYHFRRSRLRHGNFQYGILIKGMIDEHSDTVKIKPNKYVFGKWIDLN